MRIEVDGVAVTNVTLFVTAWEASELRDNMTRMVERPGSSWQGGFGVGPYRKDIGVVLEDWPAWVPLPSRTIGQDERMASDPKPWWRQIYGGPGLAEGNRSVRVPLALVIVSAALVLATGPPAWVTIVALALVVVASVGLATRQ